jgi:hypothetical protein
VVRDICATLETVARKLGRTEAARRISEIAAEVAARFARKPFSPPGAASGDAPGANANQPAGGGASRRHTATPVAATAQGPPPIG